MRSPFRRRRTHQDLAPPDWTVPAAVVVASIVGLALVGGFLTGSDPRPVFPEPESERPITVGTGAVDVPDPTTVIDPSLHDEPVEVAERAAMALFTGRWGGLSVVGWEGSGDPPLAIAAPVEQVEVLTATQIDGTLESRVYEVEVALTGVAEPQIVYVHVELRVENDQALWSYRPSVASEVPEVPSGF